MGIQAHTHCLPRTLACVRAEVPAGRANRRSALAGAPAQLEHTRSSSAAHPRAYARSRGSAVGGRVLGEELARSVEVGRVHEDLARTGRGELLER